MGGEVVTEGKGDGKARGEEMWRAIGMVERGRGGGREIGNKVREKKRLQSVTVIHDGKKEGQGQGDRVTAK